MNHTQTIQAGILVKEASAVLDVLDGNRELTEEEHEILKEELGEHYDQLHDNFKLPSKYNVSKILANTLGHAKSIAMAPVAMENSYRSFQKPDLREHAKVVKMFADKYPELMDDIDFELGYSSIGNRIRRGVENAAKKNTLLTGLGYGLRAPLGSISASLGRAAHYVPGVHTVSSFGNYPSILAHELGHAVDFGDRIDNPVEHEIYSVSRPATYLWQEYLATQKALGTMGGDEADKLRRRSRRILFPAYGTYATAGLMGGAALWEKYKASQGMQAGNPLYDAYSKYMRTIGNKMDDLDISSPYLRSMIYGMGHILPAAVAARGVAEVTNLGEALVDKWRNRNKERDSEEDLTGLEALPA